MQSSRVQKGNSGVFVFHRNRKFTAQQRGLDFALVQARHSSKVISYFATKALSTSLFLDWPGLEKQSRSLQTSAILLPGLIFKPNACEKGSRMAQLDVWTFTTLHAYCCFCGALLFYEVNPLQLVLLFQPGMCGQFKAQGVLQYHGGSRPTEQNQEARLRFVRSDADVCTFCCSAFSFYIYRASFPLR